MGSLEWVYIHDSIREEAEAAVRAEKFDDAIGAAFRVVEAAVQKRAGSEAIGQKLVHAAFEGWGRIRLAPKEQDQRSLAALFAAGFGLKGDRSHKHKPAVPCDRPDVCGWYLGFASLLLSLLAARSAQPVLTRLRLTPRRDSVARDPSLDANQLATIGLHPVVRDSALATALGGAFDVAIGAAFRQVESALQERIESTSIANPLVAEAFDGPAPRVRISSDRRDHEALRNLFVGAASIKGDRSHGVKPTVPCTTAVACAQYLVLASLLLYLLSKDLSLTPIIETVRLFGGSTEPKLEIRGQGFRPGSEVLGNAESLRVERSADGILEVSLPPQFAGDVVVRFDGRLSNAAMVDAAALADAAPTSYEVLWSDVPLFHDRECTRPVDGVVAIILRVLEGGAEETLRAVPVYPGRLKTGTYVAWGSFSDRVVGECWYRDPEDGTPKCDWSSGLIGTLEVLGPKLPERLSSITILPRRSLLRPGERRPLRVIATYSLGAASVERDVTDRVGWSSSDEGSGFVKGGILFGKSPRPCTIEATLEHFAARAEVEVGNPLPGTRRTFFEGVRRLQQMRFIGDRLVFVNQSDTVWAIDLGGGAFGRAERLVGGGTRQRFRFDCMTADRQGELFLTCNVTHRTLRLPVQGKGYGPPQPVGSAHPHESRKGIAVHPSGSVYTASMSGWIVRVAKEGTELRFPTRDMPIYLAVDNEGNICTPTNRRAAIDIYSPDGGFLRSVPHGYADSATDIAVDDRGRFLIPFFRSGALARISPQGVVEEIGRGFVHPCGVALDAEQNIYVANFGTRSIEKIYAP